MSWFYQESYITYDLKLCIRYLDYIKNPTVKTILRAINDFSFS